MDDLLSNGHRPRLRTIARRAAVTARKPHEIPEPGPIARGRPLAEVQIETEQLIANFVRDRRAKHGHVKVAQVPPGVGKTTALAKAVTRQGVAARILTSTKQKAAELAERYPRIKAVEGRSRQNCANFDLVEAARQKGHDVAALICKQCPYGRNGLSLQPWCETYGYYSQFRWGGSLVGPVELLYSGAMMRTGELVFLDDPSLELARAAGGASRLVALVRACPLERDILPASPNGGPLTVEDIEAAPPAVLGMLLRLLKFEVRAFESGQEFNSGLSIHPGGLELRELREPLTNRKG